MLQSISYNSAEKTLFIIDQLLLPHVSQQIQILTVEDGWSAIRNMSVRGAPAIAIVAMLSLCVDICNHHNNEPVTYDWIVNKLDYLKTSRPTAVNLFDACDRLKVVLDSQCATSSDSSVLRECVIKFAERLFEKDVEDNRNIGRYGAAYLMEKCSGKLQVLTHCNTGTLATAGFGTALGIIRHLAKLNQLTGVYCTETRPYNQGSRLTAYELVTDNLPNPTLITDSMAAFLFHTQKENGTPIHAVIVGADRVAANGDTANKIGTYQLALIAREHGVKFMVAAPTTSIDLALPHGSLIEIEMRKPDELRHVSGYCEETGKLEKVLVPPRDINVWNPSFDVTPAHLIDAIVTEIGVVEKQVDKSGKAFFDLAGFIQTQNQ